MKRLIYTMLGVVLMVGCSAPDPYGAVPSEAQLAWQRMEINMFCHFGPNTFTGAEWGTGTEASDIFCPTALDTRQWVQVADQAGMGGIILTAKHHDGFCLWPSALTDHSVATSQWREGKGDVLRELRTTIDAHNATAQRKLQMGVYISPWDRNHPSYGTDSYNDLFARTLAEVHAAYGPMFEQWFDGACGEGPNGKRQQYDWPLFNGTVHTANPACIIFSDIGPGCRWVGNEEGRAGATCWSTLDTAGFTPSTNKPTPEVLGEGNRGADAWIPAEVDVSIRPGWFWHADEQPKTVDELMTIYCNSVGHNGLLLLNVPPDTAGRIAAADSAVLVAFRQARQQLFGHDLMANAHVEGRHRMGHRFRPSHVLDTAYHSYWAARDTVATLRFTFDSIVEFDYLVLQEYLPLGQRVYAFEVEGDDFSLQGTTIGYKRILHADTPLRTRTLAITLHGMAAPIINRISLHRSRP